MHLLKIPYFLLFAAFMLAAKPFVGFHAVKKLREGKPFAISTKAFTKRKQEYVEGSAFDMSTVQKRLADPVLPLVVLFAAFLSFIFPSIILKIKQPTAAVLLEIHLSLFPPERRYLLSGKLTI